jgi:chromate reductase, NAD(P)H dehydrogenase (quinone)
MTTQRNIAVLVGSLRKDSFNRHIANALIKLAPSDLHFDILEIGQLPHYDQDGDDVGPPPAEWETFRQKVKVTDAVLFVTPEYNRSVPGVLKNAIDVGSRPYGKSVWDGKPAAVISVSIGGTGGFGANHYLRQSLVFLNMPTLQQPEAYVGNVASLLNAVGELTNDATRDFLAAFMTAFAAWIEVNVAR